MDVLNPITSLSLSSFLEAQADCCRCNGSRSGLIMLDCYHSVCEDCVYKCADSESNHLVRCPIAVCRHCTMFQDRTPYNLLAQDLAFVQDLKQKASANQLACCTCAGRQGETGQFFCLECLLVFCKEDVKVHRKAGRSVSKRHPLLTREEVNGMSQEELLRELQCRFGGCYRHEGFLIEKYSAVNGDYLCERCASKDFMDHLMYSTQDILATSKSVLVKSLKKAQKTSSQSLHLIASLNKEFSKVMRTKDDVLNQVADFYNNLLTEIENLREQMLSRISAKFDANLEELSACIGSVQGLADIHQRVFNYTELSYHFSSGRHLYSSYEALQEKLAKLSSDIAAFKMPNFGEVAFSVHRPPDACQELLDGFATLHLGSKYESGELIQGPAIVLPEPLLWINGIALNEDGGMFVADGNNSCVHMFSDEGYVKKIGDKTVLKCPMGVAVSGNFIYITDWMAHALLCYNISGKLIKKTGSNGSSPQEFWCPKGITISESREKVFIADLGNNRIKIYGLDLELKSYFSHDEIHRPKDVALTEDELIVLDSNSPFLHMFDFSGNLLRHLVDRSHSVQLQDPAFFTLDAEGNVVIADEVGNCIGVFYLPESKYVQHSLVNNDRTRFSEPTGIAADLNGSLIIGNNGNKEIIKCSIKTPSTGKNSI